MHRLLLLAAIALLSATDAKAQITMSPGDIAVYYVQSDTEDSFSFVALTDIAAGTEIFFADCGVQSDGTFRNNEGGVTYTAPAGGITAGTEVTFVNGSAPAEFTSGAPLCTGTFALSTSGDQVVAYQTDASDTTIQYLYAVTLNSTQFEADATSSNNTALPTGLTVGTTAVAVGSGPNDGDEFDNSVYDGSLLTGTASDILDAVGDAANWDGNDSPIAPPTYDFVVTGGGASTVTQPLVFTTPGDANSAAGWRHLSPPIDGFDIDDLAALNLVQGVPAGATNPQQYPTFGDNVLVSFDASGFVPPADTDEVIESGQGFFWYLYDRTFTPSPTPGNGTSTSTELGGFAMTATGTVPSADVMFSPPNYTVASGNRQFLIGNPFGQDLDVAGITSTPVRQSVLQTWDPSSGSYVMFEAGTPNDILAVWQGTIAELADLTTAPTFTYAAASRTGSATAPFIGRPALLPDAISLRLDGTMERGGSVTDHLAIIRFADDASAGWDLRDASKLFPPTVDFGLLAPVIERDGAPWRAAVTTLPMEPTTIPVQFTTSGAGSFAVAADVTLPGGATAILRDLETGASHDLATGPYEFTANATDWAERFEVVVSFASTAGESGPETAFRLTAPMPNPTRGAARLGLTVGTAQTVQAAVYDALGRQVLVLHDGPVAAGTSMVLRVPTDRLTPGVYVIRAQGEHAAIVHRLTVTR